MSDFQEEKQIKKLQREFERIFRNGFSESNVKDCINSFYNQSNCAINKWSTLQRSFEEILSYKHYFSDIEVQSSFQNFISRLNLWIKVIAPMIGIPNRSNLRDMYYLYPEQRFNAKTSPRDDPDAMAWFYIPGMKSMDQEYTPIPQEKIDAMPKMNYSTSDIFNPYSANTEDYNDILEGLNPKERRAQKKKIDPLCVNWYKGIECLDEFTSIELLSHMANFFELYDLKQSGIRDIKLFEEKNLEPIKNHKDVPSQATLEKNVLILTMSRKESSGYLIEVNNNPKDTINLKYTAMYEALCTMFENHPEGLKVSKYKDLSSNINKANTKLQKRLKEILGTNPKLLHHKDGNIQFCNHIKPKYKALTDE